MLALEHALERPAGLLGMVVADSPASMPLWVEEANRLRTALPAEVQAVLTAHEREGTTDSPDYMRAVDAFNRLYVCRLDPWPEPLQRAFALMLEDPTVYGTMIGPSEFHVTGSLKDWDITERLRRDRDADAADLGPARRGHAAHRRGGPPAHRGLDVGAVRVLEPHAAPRGARALPRLVRALLRRPRASELSPYSQSASRCATSTAGMHVLARGTVGNTEQSATCSPSIPCTRRRSSTTVPIAQVPAGW